MMSKGMVRNSVEICAAGALTLALTINLAWAGPHKEGKPGAKHSAKAAPAADDPTAVLKFKVKDIDGKVQKLKHYSGDVIMIVNVASKCGLTPQYKALEEQYKKYQKQGFVILGFPANNFNSQEPGTNDEIKKFCTSKFDVTFPMFAKVSVKGDDICPLYKYLTDANASHKKGGDIKWNFAKFLVNRKGEVVERFDPQVTPDDPKVTAAIEKLLGDPIPEDSSLAKQNKKDQTAKGDKHAKKDSKTSDPKKKAAPHG